MNKAQELSIGMFVTNNDKNLPIKGKIIKFTDDGKAVVKNCVDGVEYTMVRHEFDIINCTYSAKVFTSRNGDQEYNGYLNAWKLWEDLNKAIRMSEQYLANAPECIVEYIRQEYVPEMVDVNHIMDSDAHYAWMHYSDCEHLACVDDTEADILQKRLNRVYIDWLREFGYMPSYGEILEINVYYVKDGTATYSHTINNLNDTQETT